MNTDEAKRILVDMFWAESLPKLVYYHNLEDVFKDYLDEIGEPFKFGTLEYPAGRTLKEVDPICFEQEFYAWISELETNEMYIEVLENELWVEFTDYQEFVDRLLNEGSRDLIDFVVKNCSGTLREDIHDARDEKTWNSQNDKILKAGYERG